MKRSALPALALLVALGAGPASAAGIPEKLDAVNYQRLSPSLAVAGKPSAEALAALKASGFSTAMDLRLPQEGVAAAREAATAQGLAFVSVPVSPETFSIGDVRKVEALLADQKAAPVFLFCSSSNRVGGVLAVIAFRKGRTKDEAIAEGKKAGLKSAAMEKAALRVMDEGSAAAAGR
jgi:uncharacterized protein (TIGR01244 family)